MPPPHPFPLLSSLPPTPRSSFDHPPPWGGSPPGLPPRRPPRKPRPPSSSSRPSWWRLLSWWLRHLWTQLRLWRQRQEYRAGEWLLRRLHPAPGDYLASLHLLILGLLLIVIFQAMLLILAPRAR
jgi:hypothetical protein